MFEKGLFIFHRDFRIIDNIGLNNALKECEKIYAVFLFNPEQVTNKNNYLSIKSIQFMIESLEDLQTSIKNKGGKLFFFYGNYEKIVKSCIEELNIDKVYFNKDITPFAKSREKNIFNICETKNVECESYNDYYLYEPGSITTTNGVYLKFTPFYNKALKVSVDVLKKVSRFSFSNTLSSSLNKYTITLKEAKNKFADQFKLNENNLIHGGRKLGILRLKKVNNNEWEENHNILSKSTSYLSAYIKYGCLSIREVFHYMKKKYNIHSGFIRQLIWRDFYAHILFAHPYVLNNALKKNYNHLKWINNKNHFKKWCNGETGYPIVDACMKCLNEIGYLHNRGRLIVASFLVKTLLCDWRWGEKYFATKLIDYDVASNNGNWQWVASTGADSQPYFRIFNPWRQSSEYDSDCIFIYKYLPELKEVIPKHIHEWNKYCDKYKDIDYPKPIVDYSTMKEKALDMYKNN
tara:strand:+ start:682 stop:2070 length:1389 start_codon:yes stop_codon:yes gene_type:complete